jgi:2,4-dienoyl-CoA reductase-like NADH-dependent reductase (Old Yellow Enzyme family)
VMKILTPLQVGSKTIKNRVVSTAHSAFLDFFQPGNDGERYLAYQERRAEGGTGLIIATAMHVHESSVCNNHFMYEKDDISRKLNALSTRVHRHGTTAVSQLFHFGVNGKSDGREDFTPLWGFSGQVSASGEVSHKMTPDEIEEIIQSFVNSAVVAVESGMDGVELHGTHGYLIQQSFSPWGNQRDDEWGEPLRFIRTLARRVREAIGPDKLLGFRISSDDFMTVEQGGLGHAGLCDVVANVVADGHLDYLNHSEGAGGAGYARAIGSFRHPLGEWLPLTRGLKDAIDAAIPVIGVGKIPTADLAESALQAGDCDLVGMTRAQISDPDLVKKVAEGQAHRIRPCTGANQGCIDRTGSLPITCIHNPEVGQERQIKVFERAPKSKKVLIVGAGPAGMKAAELACRRGHVVTLADPGALGGGASTWLHTVVTRTTSLLPYPGLNRNCRH